MEVELTKEKFWSPLEELNEEGLKKFYLWIDDIKRRNNWQQLFNYGSPHYSKQGWHNPKFHELPSAMQFGIFLQYVSETTPLAFSGSMFSKPSVDNVVNIIKAYFQTEELSLRKENVLKND